MGLGELPCGYDHQYIYSKIVLYLKVTDLQAAIGLAPGLPESKRLFAARPEFPAPCTTA